MRLFLTATQAVIAKLAREDIFSGYCLIGGTALALQAGHRRSLDVDLVSFAAALDKNGVFRAMRKLGAELITPQSAISAARINGFDLLARVQDYVLDGVKVQCFADPTGQHYASGIQPVDGWFFGLIPLDMDDEGLDPVKVNVSVVDMYRFFEKQVETREVMEARRILQQRDQR